MSEPHLRKRYAPTGETSFFERPVQQGLALSALLVTGLLVSACEPTVKVEAPKEPITINLNIKLDADVRVKLEEAADKEIEANDDIF